MHTRMQPHPSLFSLGLAHKKRRRAQPGPLCSVLRSATRSRTIPGQCVLLDNHLTHAMVWIFDHMVGLCPSEPSSLCRTGPRFPFRPCNLFPWSHTAQGCCVFTLIVNWTILQKWLILFPSKPQRLSENEKISKDI